MLTNVHYQYINHRGFFISITLYEYLDFKKNTFLIYQLVLIQLKLSKIICINNILLDNLL